MFFSNRPNGKLVTHCMSTDLRASLLMTCLLSRNWILLQNDILPFSDLESATGISKDLAASFVISSLPSGLLHRARALSPRSI